LCKYEAPEELKEIATRSRRVKKAGYWMLDAGYLILNSGCWSYLYNVLPLFTTAFLSSLPSTEITLL
jgi:hypothetical protein